MKKIPDILNLFPEMREDKESATIKKLTRILNEINSLSALFQQRASNIHQPLRILAAGTGYMLNEVKFAMRPKFRMPTGLFYIGGSQIFMRDFLENPLAIHYRNVPWR